MFRKRFGRSPELVLCKYRHTDFRVEAGCSLLQELRLLLGQLLQSGYLFPENVEARPRPRFPVLVP